MNPREARPPGDAEFRRYHVLMHRRWIVRWRGIPLLWFRTYPIWGREVRFGRRATFEGDVMRSRYGARWPDELAAELRNSDLLTVEGEDLQGRRYRLPVDATNVGAGGRPGRPPGSGLRALVRHLRDVEGVKDYGELLTLLEGSGIEWLAAALQEPFGDTHARTDCIGRLRKAYSNGAGPHKSCPYCGADGLPAVIAERLRR